MKSTSILAACVFALPVLAQNTCHTGLNGTTLCSTPDGVIHGNTNSSGHSVYRDDHGRQLQFRVDPSGNAQLQPHSGKPIHRSQAELATRRYPSLETRPAPVQPIPPPAVAASIAPAVTPPLPPNSLDAGGQPGW